MLGPLDWTILVGYLVMMFVIGLLFTRRAGKSTNEFFISGRSLPWWLAGTSMVATSFSADTPLVVTGWVRSGGISKNWIWWSFAVGGMFSVFLLSRLWRRAHVVTDVELTELRYSGRSAAALRGLRAAYLAIPVNCVTMAWTTVAMVKLMGVLFGIHPVWAVGICLVVATFYCVFSGYWGVVVTDFVQFIIAMGGSILLCVLVTLRCGGLAALRAQAPASSALGDKLLNFFPRPPGRAALGDWHFYSTPFFAFLVYVCMQWWANKNADGGGAVIQRMSSTKDERHSLWATLWFNIANYALRPWPWILVALASVIVFPQMQDAEAAYPEMIKRFVPVGLMGLMIAYFFAAFMSTIDTFLNLSSSYAVHDVYRRFIRRHAAEKHYVFVSRVASVFFMLLSAAIALKSSSISGLFQFLLAFSSGIGLVYVLRWFWWRINAWSEISAMLASGTISCALYLARGALGNLSPEAILAITTVCSTLIWVAVTFLTTPVSDEKLVAFYRRVRPYGAWGRIARESGVARPTDLGRLLAAWVAGAVMVLAATFSVGKFLLGAALEGWLYLAAAAIGAVIVWREVARMTSDAAGDAAPGEAEARLDSGGRGM